MHQVCTQHSKERKRLMYQVFNICWHLLIYVVDDVSTHFDKNQNSEIDAPPNLLPQSFLCILPGANANQTQTRKTRLAKTQTPWSDSQSIGVPSTGLRLLFKKWHHVTKIDPLYGTKMAFLSNMCDVIYLPWRFSFFTHGILKLWNIFDFVDPQKSFQFSWERR